MQNKKIVLDTNCLLVSISKYGKAYPIWREFLAGKYVLCVSTEILEEYEEIISDLTTPYIAKNVIDTILKRKNVEFITTYFHWNLILSDPDDNKFVDCALCAGAEYIVSNDKHFNELKEIDFPKIEVVKIYDFIKLLVC